MSGIVSYATYIPYHRLPRSLINKAWGRGGGQGEKAVASFDEDSISMSVASAMESLEGTDNNKVDALFMATTTAPYKEGQNSTIVATALALRRDIRNADVANCLRAGTTAMLTAADVVTAGSARTALVTAADMRLGGASGENEIAFGDGAAALLLGNEGIIAEIEGSYTLSDGIFDNWRSYDDIFVRSWEDRFGLSEGYLKIPIEAAAGVMKNCGLTQKDFTRVCLYGPNSRRQAELGKLMGFELAQIQDPMLEAVGNTGTALPLMILAAALDEAKPGDRILLISYGNGSDAIVLRVTKEIEKNPRRGALKRHLQTKRTLESYQSYLRWRRMLPLEATARPDNVPASMASLWRENRSALPLYGVKCKRCGTPQLYLDLASSRARVCVECQAIDQFEDYRFADKKGTVVSFSHDHLDRSEDPPNTLAIVDFEGGGRGSFAMTDRNPQECRVGMRVEMTFRRISFERGIHNYYWKCKPLRD